MVPWVEQTSVQLLLRAVSGLRAFSSATDTVGINAFSRTAKMAIQLESARRGRASMSVGSVQEKSGACYKYQGCCHTQAAILWGNHYSQLSWQAFHRVCVALLRSAARR